MLRSIGDAVAFIYGDRYELKQLLQEGDAGFITGKRGTRLERKILREAFRLGATVVMNDLTNTLGRGDFTLFQPDIWPDGNSPIVGLIEAKSGGGGNKKRAKRQQKSADEILEYIRTDFRETEDGYYFRVSPQESPRHNFDAISRLIKTLPKGGWNTEEVENGLYYAILSCDMDEAQFPEALAPILGLGHSMFLIYVNQIKEQKLGYYPFPLCIRHAESLYRFYNGEFVIDVFVDIHYVNERLRERGIKIEIEDGGWNIMPIIPDPEWGVRRVLPRAVGLLAGEFISLEWFVNNMLRAEIPEELKRILEGAAATFH